MWRSRVMVNIVWESRKGIRRERDGEEPQPTRNLYLNDALLVIDSFVSKKQATRGRHGMAWDGMGWGERTEKQLANLVPETQTERARTPLFPNGRMGGCETYFWIFLRENSHKNRAALLLVGIHPPATFARRSVGRPGRRRPRPRRVSVGLFVTQWLQQYDENQMIRDRRGGAFCVAVTNKSSDGRGRGSQPANPGKVDIPSSVASLISSSFFCARMSAVS